MFTVALTKVCTDCFEKKSIDDFDTDYGRTYCKKCKNLRHSNAQTIKRAKVNPDRYNNCNDCDRSYGHMYRPMFIKKCRYCKSENVEPWN